MKKLALLFIVIFAVGFWSFAFAKDKVFPYIDTLNLEKVEIAIQICTLKRNNLLSEYRLALIELDKLNEKRDLLLAEQAQKKTEATKKKAEAEKKPSKPAP